MFRMIRQFTFHKPKEILWPTFWLFLSQAFSMIPAVLAYMAIYTLGQAFVPPYTLDFSLLVTLAAARTGLHTHPVRRGAGFLLLYLRPGLPGYGRQTHCLHPKATPSAPGLLFGKGVRRAHQLFADDFANVEYTLCWWLPYPIGVGLLLVISVVWISVYDWRMGLCHVRHAPGLRGPDVWGRQSKGEAQPAGHGGKSPCRHPDQ